ncbi:hypothetical protein [Leptolyngbya sp. FACHB-16]|nr:hypothetical protein [Leptolyngbya sp. FACHB-16]
MCKCVKYSNGGVGHEVPHTTVLNQPVQRYSAIARLVGFKSKR